MDPLIERAQQGDPAALASLVREHYPSVFRFCARRLGPDLGQDAAQETFVTMHKSLKKFQGTSSLSTWLLGIAHNHVRSLSRKRSLQPAPIDAWLDVPASGPDETGLIQREQLRQALSALSEDHRQVVLMHEIEGLKYAEIAEVLAIPEGTVKSRLFHAFRSLRTSLAEATP